MARAKQWTDDAPRLDVRALRRQELLAPGRLALLTWPRCTAELRACGDDKVLLTQRRLDPLRGEWTEASYGIGLSWTPCHLGGRRAWWQCPVAGCGRRVAILYGGQVFGCRHCRQLTYRTQYESPHDRALRRANSLRRELGWPAGVLNGHGGRRQGMQMRTYIRLLSRYVDAERLVLAGMTAWLDDLREETDRALAAAREPHSA